MPAMKIDRRQKLPAPCGLERRPAGTEPKSLAWRHSIPSFATMAADGEN
ncbi:MAG: hypothetical protein MUF20_13175 [Methylotetracoccus sp.]|nr:hypothetical protein [Methylotetracoccus sp.]